MTYQVWVPGLETGEMFAKAALGFSQPPQLPIIACASPYGKLYAIVAENKALFFSSREQADRVSRVLNYKINGLPEASELLV